MKVDIDERIDEFVNSLPEGEKGRISRYIDLFTRYHFELPSKYLKKLDRNLWELRPGNIRILFGKINNETYCVVHVFKKKTKKTPARELKKAKLRLKEKII